jgi:hypothetical protein
MTSFARTIALAGMLLIVTPSAAALQDQPRPPSETTWWSPRFSRWSIAWKAARSFSIRPAFRNRCPTRSVLQGAVERDLIVGPRARYLRCEIVCRVVGADAVISVASSAIAADGTGTVTVQSWQGGADSPRGALRRVG